MVSQRWWRLVFSFVRWFEWKQYGGFVRCIHSSRVLTSRLWRRVIQYWFHGRILSWMCIMVWSLGKLRQTLRFVLRIFALMRLRNVWIVLSIRRLRRKLIRCEGAVHYHSLKHIIFFYTRKKALRTRWTVLYHKKLVSPMNKSMMICRMSAVAPMIQSGLRFLS